MILGDNGNNNEVSVVFINEIRLPQLIIVKNESHAQQTLSQLPWMCLSFLLWSSLIYTNQASTIWGYAHSVGEDI